MNDSDAPPMKLVPRIRLRTVFLLFFCAAVGLATYGDPVGAMEPAIATAMVIGLIQQSRQLQLWVPPPDSPTQSLIFARAFAITWRLLIAALIGFCLIVTLLNRGGPLRLADETRIGWYFHFLFRTLTVCTTVVMCNSLARWQPALLDDNKHLRRYGVFWLVAVTFALIVLVQGSLVLFLTHRAMEGIEAAFPKFRRPGVYPALGEEGFWSFWLATAAVLSVVAAGAILMWLMRNRVPTATRQWGKTLVVLLLSFCTVFCYWYYTKEYHRLSPDLAGVELAAGFFDWLTGGMLAIMLITAGAYRLSRSTHLKAQISANLAFDIDSTALHESAPCLLIIAFNSVYTLGLTAEQIITGNSVFGRTSLWEFISSFSYPEVVLVLAHSLAGLRLVWVRWRRRFQEVPWEAFSLSRPVFLQSWLSLAVLLIIGVPTLSAFAFIAWLGPWDLLPLYGF
ncbi:MAG: hypothetical protein WD229_04395 [Pirellulales bacterium]